MSLIRRFQNIVGVDGEICSRSGIFSFPEAAKKIIGKIPSPENIDEVLTKLRKNSESSISILKKSTK